MCPKSKSFFTSLDLSGICAVLALCMARMMLKGAKIFLFFSFVLSLLVLAFKKQGVQHLQKTNQVYVAISSGSYNQ